jgi:hypothetical protein
MAEWQKIGGIEVCVGGDGVVGILWAGGSLSRVAPDGKPVAGFEAFLTRGDAKVHFERLHCQQLHEIEECADGSVIVRSVEKIDGKMARAAIVRAFGSYWWADYIGGANGPSSKDEAIAAAVAYVSTR